MAKHIILDIVIGVLIVGVLFCLLTLIYSSLNDITFVEQLKTWFTVTKKVADKPEVVEKTVEMLLHR